MAAKIFNVNGDGKRTEPEGHKHGGENSVGI